MIAAIKKTTSKPISRIILSHSDGDHINGLNGFPTGLKIYAHPQTKKDMEEAAGSPNTSYLKDYYPTEECSPCAASRESVMTVPTGRQPLQIFYFGPAHTSGDFVIYFPEEKAAFLGDLVFVGRDPLIHRHKNGSSTGLLKNLEGILGLDADIFLSGHADPLGKPDIRKARDSIAGQYDKVKAMVADGRSLDEVKKAFGIEEPAAKSGGFSFTSLAETIYLDITENDN
jgi:glyoxylase-like metal-dependent hydrolase (beta-lactamase superfamily II)